jgi:hypothetical protein
MRQLLRNSTLLLLFSALLLPGFVSAQKTLRQKMADDFCTELTKQNLPDTYDEKSMEQIGLVILPVVGKYKDQIKKEMGLEMTTQEDFQKVGEMIGQEAVLTCPKFQKMMTKMTEGQSSEVKMLSTVNGTFLGVATSGNFNYLRIKGADGREVKVWWFQFFQGADLLANPAALKDKAVTLSVLEEEVYEPTLKDYVKIKVAKSLTVK